MWCETVGQYFLEPLKIWKLKEHTSCHRLEKSEKNVITMFSVGFWSLGHKQKINLPFSDEIWVFKFSCACFICYPQKTSVKWTWDPWTILLLFSFVLLLSERETERKTERQRTKEYTWIWKGFPWRSEGDLRDSLVLLRQVWSSCFWKSPVAFFHFCVGALGSEIPVTLSGDLNSAPYTCHLSSPYKAFLD